MECTLCDCTLIAALLGNRCVWSLVCAHQLLVERVISLKDASARVKATLSVIHYLNEQIRAEFLKSISCDNACVLETHFFDKVKRGYR
jgi:hypothetical protein